LDWGSTSGGGGCCFANGCGKSSVSDCPTGYTATRNYADKCDNTYQTFCCRGPVYDACVDGTNRIEKLGCGRRAVGRSYDQCDSDCVSCILPQQNVLLCSCVWMYKVAKMKACMLF
jgi:hypothetical protein